MDKRVNVRMEYDLYVELKAKLDEEGMSLSEFFRNCAKEYIDIQSDIQSDIQELHQLITELSERLDEHIEDERRQRKLQRVKEKVLDFDEYDCEEKKSVNVNRRNGIELPF